MLLKWSLSGSGPRLVFPASLCSKKELALEEAWFNLKSPGREYLRGVKKRQVEMAASLAIFKYPKRPA